jgi:hypothetical protein
MFQNGPMGITYHNLGGGDAIVNFSNKKNLKKI